MEIVKAEHELKTPVPTSEELDAYETNIDLTMDEVKSALASNESKLLTGKLGIDKLLDLYNRQSALGNAYSWLVQVKHNRVIQPRELKRRIIKPGI